MHAVSGALSLPSRGAFHLSLMVLCTIGHPLVFSLGGWSPRLRAGFHVSRPTLRRPDISAYLQACHLLWGGFPSRFVKHPCHGARPGSSPFAHHYSGNLGWFLFLRVLRCFSSPGLPPQAYVFGLRIRLRVGFPIRIPGSQRPFAPRAGLSGLGPSFVAGGCLGIPRVHSFA